MALRFPLPLKEYSHWWGTHERHNKAAGDGHDIIKETIKTELIEQFLKARDKK